MSFPSLRRAGALLGGGALAAGLLVGAPAAQAASSGPERAEAAGAWLADQLEDGAIVNQEFDFVDWGLTLDVLFALDDVGGFEAEVEAIRAALEPNVGGYIGSGDELYAGSVAKAAVGARVAGGDPQAFGGLDLIERLESTVTDSEDADAGRVADQSEWGDYANTFSQIFAARALAEADSDLTGDVVGYLALQQCSDGYLRLYFDSLADNPAQSCDAAASPSPSVDTTALAVISLIEGEVSGAQALVGDAVSWLLTVQNDDGSFGDGDQLDDPNTNSTGLAARALALADESSAAADAASWIAQQQLLSSVCAHEPFADHGAIALDAAALADLSDGRIADLDRDQWIRASSQGAAPLALFDGPTLPDAAFEVTASPEIVEEGSEFSLEVTGLAAGETACVLVGETVTEATADAQGVATLTVTAPAVEADTALELQVYGAHEGRAGVATVQVIAVDEGSDDDGAASFDLELDRDSYRPGDPIAISGGGLPADTEVTVELHSDPVVLGAATTAADGSFTLDATIPAATSLGEHTVVATAEVAGDTLRAEVTVRIVAAASASALPATGAPMSWYWLLVAVSIVAVGTALVMAGRARRLTL